MGAEFSDDKKKKRKYNSKMNKDYIIIIKKSHSVYSDREAQKWLNLTEQTNIDKMEESQERKWAVSRGQSNLNVKQSKVELSLH